MVCNTRGVELFAGVTYSLESQQVTKLRKAEKRKGWAGGAGGARRFWDHMTCQDYITYPLAA